MPLLCLAFCSLRPTLCNSSSHTPTVTLQRLSTEEMSFMCIANCSRSRLVVASSSSIIFVPPAVTFFRHFSLPQSGTAVPQVSASIADYRAGGSSCLRPRAGDCDRSMRSSLFCNGERLKVRPRAVSLFACVAKLLSLTPQKQFQTGVSVFLTHLRRYFYAKV